MKGLWLSAALVAILVVVEAVVPNMAAQGLSPSQCNAQKKNIKNRCRNAVLLRQNPSAACCQLVKTTNIECFCQLFTPKLVAALGGADRAIKLIRGCGKTIPRNFKCGSLTTPP